MVFQIYSNALATYKTPISKGFNYATLTHYPKPPPLSIVTKSIYLYKNESCSELSTMKRKDSSLGMTV